jgi:hypothetical protein
MNSLRNVLIHRAAPGKAVHLTAGGSPIPPLPDQLRLTDFHLADRGFDTQLTRACRDWVARSTSSAAGSMNSRRGSLCNAKAEAPPACLVWLLDPRVAVNRHPGVDPEGKGVSLEAGWRLSRGLQAAPPKPASAATYQRVWSLRSMPRRAESP